MVLIAHMMADLCWNKKFRDYTMGYIMVNTMLKRVTAEVVALKMLGVVHLLVKDIQV